MSLVGKVGRKRPRARFAMALIYLVLILGAITTVYPFLLMFTTGLKGPTDQNDNLLVPLYTRDEDELLKKYLDDKYAGNASMVASTRIGEDCSPAEVRLYRRFLQQLPNDCWTAGFRVGAAQVTSRLMSRYDNWLRERYHGDVDALNKAYIEENVDFGTVQPPAELFERKNWKPTLGRKWDEWQEFKRSLPVEFRIPIRTQRLWQEFLRAKFQNQITAVPETVAHGAKTFEDIPAFSVATFSSKEGGRLGSEFAATSLPDRYKKDSAETRWDSYANRHGIVKEAPGSLVSKGDTSVAVVGHSVELRFRPNPNSGQQAWSYSVPPISAPMPIAAEERAWVHERAPEIRREFAGRNYDYVLDYILLHGRALWNTAIFCLLAIATQLFVNPLAAYALSRYPIKASGKILIFLLATMAFPAEVAMIPAFLLLKDLGLLNTFAALVLPGAASGYMIFLLKGFFDSLPQELFEAGSLDGAKETTMLARIALPLSKPVLGYLALLAFMGAYGAFIYAFLIAQDQRMWTLMVFVYQLQNVAPRSVTMAALTLAALPTLIVFLFAQRVIMRGIVLPGER